MIDPALPHDDPRIGRTRHQAMEATLELLAESGLQGCTFETISERSGVARSTLYRHWNNKTELLMDALRGQVIDRTVPDTGNLRDDVLTAMLELGHALRDTPWGAMVAQLMAAAAIDSDVAQIQEAASDYHVQIESSIIQRAIDRGEIANDIDPHHTALLFSAPIFYRHLFSRQRTDDKWITNHIDKTVTLLQAN